MNVTDFKGKSIPKSSAALIKGQYYEVGKDCIKYQGVHYRVTSNKVVKDHSTGKFYHVNQADSLNRGIVGPNMEIGFFSDTSECVSVYYLEKESVIKDRISMRSGVFDPQHDENLEGGRVKDLRQIEGVRVKKGGVIYKWCRSNAVNYDIAVENGFVESYSSYGMFKLSDCDSETRKLLYTKATPRDELVKDVYNICDSPRAFETLKKNYAKLLINSSPKDKRIAKIIGEYSFGLEFEVTNGFLPEYFREKYGIKGLRDGSVANTGLEYVTVPMSNMKGISTLRKISEVLVERCENDKSCSLHNHMGNVSMDKMFAVALWVLGTKIQDEVFKAMPEIRLQPKDDGTVYCQKLPDIGIDPKSLLNCKTKAEFDQKLKDSFARIYMFLNERPPGEIYNTQIEKIRATVEGEEIFKHVVRNERYTVKSTTHSVRGQKWQRKARYYWLNLMPLYFSTYHTVEFRCHEATLNPTKVLAWLVFTACVLNYAKDHKACFENSKITIEDILRKTLVRSPRMLKFMLEYFEHRKQYFAGKSKDEKIKNSLNWIREDGSFTFKSSEGFTI